MARSRGWSACEQEEGKAIPRSGQTALPCDPLAEYRRGQVAQIRRTAARRCGVAKLGCRVRPFGTEL
eukprot:5798833-Karenia_brevis.AAC.1